ncbi:MAG: family 78 glycoside hydrolase catalytic domain [Terracidiphilus sp.]
MNMKICRASVLLAVIAICLGLVTAMCASAAGAQASSPAALRVDEMSTPLGIDDAQPRFSWQLRDSRQNARQTAYRLLVASQPELLAVGKADVWDSGRVASAQSVGVPYAGAALAPSTRYHWKVLVWDQAGEPAPESPVSWWETGLMKQDWRAQWIGYETPEEAAVRHASAEWIASPDQIPMPDALALPSGKPFEQHIAYRQTVTLAKPVLHATLYATAQDTVSAWINGAQVMTANPYPPWRQFPWKKFVRADATSALTTGSNSIAIEQVHYLQPSEKAASLPMIATLFVEYADESTEVFASGTSWKSSLEFGPGWQQKNFDDAGWKNAIEWKPAQGTRDEPLGHPWIPDLVKIFHSAFTVNTPVKSARLYATALGAYEMFLNGQRVGDQVLAPGWTDYRERVVYQTYDVTDQVVQGKNAISAMLAPGWYETPLEWFQQPNNYGDTPPALRAQLRIEHTDGSVEWIKTGMEWQANTSYILHSELYDGETQDDRAILLTLGSSVTSVIADSWPHAIPIDPRPVEIVAQSFPPVRVERELQAISLTEPKAGVYVYDFGQNFSGVESLKLKGPEGTDLRLRFAEVLNADGTVYSDNLRTAKATDHFVLGGARVTEFSPQFTFHGFRYAELTGLPYAPDKDAVTGMVFHTDAPFTIQLKTGNALINQLWSNILWGQRSNFVGVPTDCPQRDERLGWMGDAQVFWRAASYNMDLAAFSRKFAADMRGTQVGTPYYGIYAPGTSRESKGWGPGWSDAGVIVPWTSWLQTGDMSIIEENWAAMEKYLDAIAAANPDGLWRNEYGIPFGDWLSPEGKTDIVLIATAYWAYDVTLMREMAHATGRSQAEEKYRQLFEKIRAAFEKQFVHEDGFVAGADNSASPFGAINNPNAKSHGGDTQTGYVLALHMNLLPQELRAAAAKKLVAKIEANHSLLATGFLGTPYLLEELTKAGYPELAYKLLLNTEYPSWGYMVQHGATTMWERWNGDQMIADPGMNSFNHYAYGAVADWIYRYAAGIDATPLDAGFHTIILHPVFDRRLGSLDLRYQSAYGEIHSSWSVEGDRAHWTVTIPPNAKGWLRLSQVEAANFTLNGKPLVKPVEKDGRTGYEFEAGTYSFEVMGVR